MVPVVEVVVLVMLPAGFEPWFDALVLRLPATNLGQSWMVTGLILAQSGTGREIVGDNLRLLQAAWD